jgi:hypothetical protein
VRSFCDIFRRSKDFLQKIGSNSVVLDNLTKYNIMNDKKKEDQKIINSPLSLLSSPSVKSDEYGSLLLVFLSQLIIIGKSYFEDIEEELYIGHKKNQIEYVDFSLLNRHTGAGTNNYLSKLYFLLSITVEIVCFLILGERFEVELEKLELIRINMNKPLLILCVRYFGKRYEGHTRLFKVILNKLLSEKYSNLMRENLGDGDITYLKEQHEILKNFEWNNY